MLDPGAEAREEQEQQQRREAAGPRARGDEAARGRRRAGDEQRPLAPALGEQPRRQLERGHGTGAYGTIDELNAIVGIVRTFNEERLADGAHHRWLDETLRRIQNELFDLGSELATPPQAEYEGMFKVGEEQVSALERLMDRCQKDLEPLKSFTLPGGGRLNAFLHQARTVCRRAEREVLALSRVEPINAWALRYVNRLSDAFFVLGRWVGKRMGEKEYLWERGLASHARAKRKRS